MTPQHPRLPDELVTRIDDLFRRRVEQGTAPSTAWGVFDRSGLLVSGGHGDRGDGRAPDADTVYRIASCTKSVTAATLLTLVAAGRLSLDDPITDFVPAFADVPLPSPDSPVPTLRMLLTMSAGLPTDDPWADRQEPISDAAFDAVLRDGLLFDSIPGTRFAYSNTGYALLGRAVSAAAGRPFAEVAADAVLRPLRLDSTTFSAAESPGFVVTGHRPHGDVWEPLPTTGPGAFSPIGGLFSTVSDLARWAAHLAAAFDDDPAGTPDGAHSPVSRADRRLMQQAVRVVPSAVLPGATRATAYGLGLFVEQDDRHGELVSHSGGYPGFSAHMRWSVRDGLGVVAFENATQAKVSVGAAQAHDLLLDALSRPASEAVPTALQPTVAATRRAQRAVSRLLADWRDDVADALFTPNVAQDVPYDRRRRAVAQAVAEVGADLTAEPVEERSTTPTHLRWWLPGTSGRLRVEIRLAPLAAGLVQTLTVTAEPSER